MISAQKHTAHVGPVATSSAMWGVAAQLAVIYMLSTIPTPLYAIYEQQFGFSRVVLTLIFAVYVVGTVAAMFFLGRLSDQIGRRPVVLWALLIAAVGALIFLAAAGTAWLFVGRIFSGLAIALSAGASTAWIVELEPHHDKARATRVAMGMNLAGLGLGSLGAGLLAQYSPYGLRLVFVSYLVLLLFTAIVIATSPRTVRDPKPLREASLRPRFGVPVEIRRQFIAPAVAAFATLSVIGFYSGLIPGLLKRVFGQANHASAGGIVATLFFVGVCSVIGTASLKSRTGLMASLALLVPGIILLAVAELAKSLPILITGTVVAGLATGPAFLFSLRAVNEMSPADRRAEVVSSYLIVCYCGNSLPVIGIGLLAHATSPRVADLVFAAVITGLAILAFVVESRFSTGKTSPTNRTRPFDT